MRNSLSKYFLTLCLRCFNRLLNLRSLSVPPISDSHGTYDNLIVVTGFGNSGSGTIMDFLSEFDNTTVIGYHDLESGGQLSQNEVNITEVDFLCYAGGVFSLEDVVESNNICVKDFSIKLLITISEYCYKCGGIYTDEFMKYTNEFIEALLNFKIKSPRGGREHCPAFSFIGYSGFDYKNLKSPFVDNKYKDTYIYNVKAMSRSEYITIASQYIQKFLHSIPSKSYLVLDQFLSDGNPDVEYHQKYCGDFKQICVFRDPRDVYVTGIHTNTSWMPWNVHEFIVWYRSKVAPYLTYSHDDMLILRFEDIVLSYDAVSQSIMDFVGLTVSNHVYPKGWFDPSISAKNIGIWKSFSDQETIRVIEKELGDYCYYHHSS